MVAVMAAVVVVLVVVTAASQASKPIFGDARSVIALLTVLLLGHHCC
jgi:hypothetical protein